MGSHVHSIDPQQERGLIAAVDRWQATLAPARLDALSDALSTELVDGMTERQLLQALRQAIEADSRTLNAIAVDAGLSPSIVWRFIEQKRSLSLEAALALADTLGLEVSLRKKRK
jgi:DNA-binding phage protein